MISKQDLERLLDRTDGAHPILSLFLDMSVNADNKRTHQIFLNQKRAQFAELDSDRESHHREAIGAALARVDEWLASGYEEENRGVVIYTEVGGDWMEALQFPIAVDNRLIIAPRPAIGPLAQVITSYHHHAVVLLDREHVRILSVYLGTLLDEIEVRGEPYPAPHDVQAGGYSHQRYQRRKREEMRHFFKEFVKELEDFVRRYEPDDIIILGTEENVARFKEFLPNRLGERVVYTGPMSVDEATSEVLARIEPHLERLRQLESRELLMRLRERVEQDYLATAGFQSTLTALQEGKVDTLLIAQDQEVRGSKCQTCGFVFAREVETCPYDGSRTENGIDAVEAAIRIATAQDVAIEFIPSSELGDLRGVGAMLRF